jgi:Mce-associated membrane protein
VSSNPSRHTVVVDHQLETARALALAEAAEAEADAAEAAAAAAQARAHALRLRPNAARQDLASGTPIAAGDQADACAPGATAAAEGELCEEEQETTDGATAIPGIRRRWAFLGRPRRRLAASAAAILLACGMVGAGAFLLWQHQESSANERRTTEFAAAARQGVVTLMSMDFAHAKEDVQRVIDNTTGSFKDDFVKQSADFTTTVQQSQVTTVTTVNGTAVKSMTDDSANVLVAATSEVTNAAGAKQEPRAWRLAVTVTRDGDQLKLSKVEFVQ